MAEQKTVATKGRKPSTKTTTEEPIVVNNDLQTELDKTKKEKDDLANMLKLMQEQMAQMQEQINNKNNNNGNVIINQNDNLTRTVEVISLIGNTYNLCTQPLGQGKVYTFEKFGEKKSIRFSDMQDILTLVTPQFEEGFAVLTNKKDYDDLGIGYIYDNVMSKDKLEKLILLKDEDSVDIILELNEDMQDKVVELIARNISNGVSYDYNKIKQLEDEGFEINELVALLNASTEK